MSRRLSFLISLLVAALVGTLLTGCTCICKKNKKACLPTITCQPIDQAVTSFQDAIFEVKAEGHELSYQWFSEKSNVVQAIPGANTNILVVSTNVSDRVGFYWCLIDSDCPMGVMETRTRSASLTTKSLLLNALEQGLLRVSASGSNACCHPICGYINFNNSNAGYKPLAGQTQGIVTLTTDSQGNNAVDTSLYEGQWKYGGGANQYGCLNTLSTTQKGFTVPVAGVAYFFTIYIKTSCPPSGTPYYLKVMFQ